MGDEGGGGRGDIILIGGRAANGIDAVYVQAQSDMHVPVWWVDSTVAWTVVTWAAVSVRQWVVASADVRVARTVALMDVSRVVRLVGVMVAWWVDSTVVWMAVTWAVVWAHR